jgi:hypothetical protein
MSASGRVRRDAHGADAEVEGLRSSCSVPMPSSRSVVGTAVCTTSAAALIHFWSLLLPFAAPYPTVSV